MVMYYSKDLKILMFNHDNQNFISLQACLKNNGFLKCYGSINVASIQITENKALSFLLLFK